MKLSTKIILPIIIISALLILLTGCFGVPDDSPGYTSGSVTGVIMVPEDCTDCETGVCDTENSNDVPDNWVPVEGAIVTVIPYATKTNEDGYYNLTDVEPGFYYVITATFGNLVLKDIVEPPGVEASEIYDAGIADCESTSLGLIVEALLDLGFDSEDIEMTLEMVKNNPKFNDLKNLVCSVIENCGNVTNYCEITELVEDIIDDEPGFTCLLLNPNLEIAIDNTNPCMNDCATISSITVSYTDGITVPLIISPIYAESTPGLSWEVDSGISFNPSNGTVCLDGGIADKDYHVTFTYTDECDVTATGIVTVNFTPENCILICCPVLDQDLEIAIDNTNPCLGDCATINSVTVSYIDGTTPDLVIESPYSDKGLSWVVAPAGISFNSSNGTVCGGVVGTAYEITFTYKDECGLTATGIATVSFDNCDDCYNNYPPVINKVEYDDGTGFKEIQEGDIIHVISGGSYTVRADVSDDGIKEALTFQPFLDTTALGIYPYPGINIGLNIPLVSWSVGSHELTIEFYDGCTTTTWGPVTIVVDPVTYTLTMAVEPSGKGTTTPAVGSHTYSENEVVTLSAVAISGWKFVNWSGDASGNSPTTTVVMDSDKNVIAHFAEGPAPTIYTLTTAVNPAGSGSVTGGGLYNAGATATVKATPTSGWKFTGWSGALTGATNPGNILMNADKTVTANFTLIPPTQYTLTLYAGSNGSVNDGVNGDYDEGTPVGIVATPDPGYEFSGWTVDLGAPANVVNTGASTNVTMDEDMTLTANFDLIPPTQYTLTLYAGSNGSVNDGVNGLYNEGTPVGIVATPDPGYEFSGWTVNLGAPTNVANTGNASTDVTMNEDMTLTANFASAIIIEGLHANLGSGDETDVWDLHVWASMNNTSGQIFEGKIEITSYHESTHISKEYPLSPITITLGKNKYPADVDYWLLSEVATGHGAQKDVLVVISIYDTFNNLVASASKYAD